MNHDLPAEARPVGGERGASASSCRTSRNVIHEHQQRLDTEVNTLREGTHAYRGTPTPLLFPGRHKLVTSELLA